MKPAKLGFLLAFFIFCSLTAPGLSGIARLTKMLCNEYKDPCSMDVDPGKCFEAHLKFFYNRTAKECQVFVFNGCDGNLNNFNLKIECDITCNEDYRTVRYTKPPETTTQAEAAKAGGLLETKEKKSPLRARRRSRNPQKSKRHPRARHHISAKKIGTRT